MKYTVSILFFIFSLIAVNHKKFLLVLSNRNVKVKLKCYSNMQIFVENEIGVIVTVCVSIFQVYKFILILFLEVYKDINNNFQCNHLLK